MPATPEKQAELPEGIPLGSVQVQVVNIFARVDFGRPLDLRRISLAIHESEYEPETTPGLIVRTKEPRSCVTLYRSGVARCTGCRSSAEVQVAADRIAARLQDAGEPVSHPRVDIRNVVGIVDTGRGVHLERLAEAAAGSVDYEPEQFPGAFVRFGGPAVATVFGSGRIILNGVKSTGQARELGERVLQLLAAADAWL